MRDITLEDTIYMDFTTRSFSTGVPTQLAGTPALSVLEENNATPITSGVSVAVDRASVTGLNMATVVATAANGYEAGKGYSVYISTGTVGGVSVVGEKVGEFTIQANPVNWGRVTAPTTAVDLSGTDIQLVDTATALTNGATLANGAITDASLAGNMEIVFETDFATNYNTTRNAWATNTQDFVGTAAADPFNGQVVAASVTAGVSLAAGAITDASLAGNMEIVFETDFATNYNATRNAWATNVQDFVGTTAADPFSAQVVAASMTGHTVQTGDTYALANGATGFVAIDTVVDSILALLDDARTEPGQGAPPVNPDLATKIDYLYKAWRNKTEQTATTLSLYDDAGSTVDQKSTVSDDGTTATRGEMATGP